MFSLNRFHRPFFLLGLFFEFFSFYGFAPMIKVQHTCSTPPRGLYIFEIFTSDIMIGLFCVFVCLFICFGGFSHCFCSNTGPFHDSPVCRPSGSTPPWPPPPAAAAPWRSPMPTAWRRSCSTTPIGMWSTWGAAVFLSYGPSVTVLFGTSFFIDFMQICFGSLNRGRKRIFTHNTGLHIKFH